MSMPLHSDEGDRKMSSTRITKRRAAIASVVVLSVAAGGMYAAAQQGPGGAVSQKITYQGYIEQDGSPVNGSRDLRFCLVTSASSTCAAALYWERENVNVAAGVFHVVLGDGGTSSSHASFNAVGSSPPLFQRNPLFLRVGVPSGAGSAPATDTMFADAQEIVSTPSSFTSEQAQNLRVAGTLTALADVFVTSGIEVGNHPGTTNPADGELWVAGALRTAGAATFSSGVTIAGNSSVAGTLTVTGTLSYGGQAAPVLGNTETYQVDVTAGNSGDINIAPLGRRVCFLNTVNYNGGGQHICHIDTNGTHWTLRAFSPASGAATVCLARCFTW